MINQIYLQKKTATNNFQYFTKMFNQNHSFDKINLRSTIKTQYRYLGLCKPSLLTQALQKCNLTTSIFKNLTTLSNICFDELYQHLQIIKKVTNKVKKLQNENRIQNVYNKGCVDDKIKVNQALSYDNNILNILMSDRIYKKVIERQGRISLQNRKTVLQKKCAQIANPKLENYKKKKQHLKNLYLKTIANHNNFGTTKMSNQRIHTDINNQRFSSDQKTNCGRISIQNCNFQNQLNQSLLNQISSKNLNFSNNSVIHSEQVSSKQNLNLMTKINHRILQKQKVDQLIKIGKIKKSKYYFKNNNRLGKGIRFLKNQQSISLNR